MTNLTITEYIKQYAKENNFRFSDFDMASIVYHQEMTMDDKQKLLRKIARKTRDNTLKIQVSQRIKEDAKAISLFNENEGEYVYVLAAGDDEYSAGFYSTFKAAFVAGLKTAEAFDIEKYAVMNENERGLSDPVATISFDREGNPMSCSSDELEGHEEKVEMNSQRFEARYIDMPNPFETGDIVFSERKNLCGVVITSSEEWNRKKNLEDRRYEDCLLSVDFYEEDGYFENDEVEPIELEKIFPENSSVRGMKILKKAGDLVKGQCSISEFITLYALEGQE